MRVGIILATSAALGAAIAIGQLCAAGGSGGGIGPDVVYTDCQSIAHWGSAGGIRGYSLGSFTCNIGDQNLLWGSTHNGTPVLGMNAYRLHDGRLVQIGMSWAKNGTGAAAGSGCNLVCNGQGGSVLGVGCRDVYSSGFNGIQSILQARSEINAFTGDMPSAPGGSGDDIFRRLQIAEADLNAVSFPGALYFVEGVYVSTDDAAAGNALNNASHKRVSVGTGFSLLLAGPIQQTIPAIFAWQDHGNGLDTPDPSVEVVAVDVPGEGRFLAAGKAADNGDGTWRYEYAVFNLNSHRSARSLVVPAAGATISNPGFHDVDYHSGEVYDSTDWSWTVNATTVQWQSPATFEEDQLTNALRWGTMYNFWFDADQPPTPGQVRIELFRPGSPAAVSASLPVPVATCPGNCGASPDTFVGVDDLLELLSQWGGPGTCDLDGNGVGVTDLLILLANWGDCP